MLANALGIIHFRVALGGLLIVSACAHRQPARHEDPSSGPRSVETANTPKASTQIESKAAKTIPRERMPQTCEQHVAQVRSAIGKLSQQRWSGARSQADTALTFLADAIEDAGKGKAAVTQAIFEVRLQVQRFKDSEPLEHIAPLKSALKGSARALELLGREVGIQGLDGWLASSNRAVDALSLDVPFQLQRAAIQDAFRTLADTFVVAMQLSNKC